MPPWQRHLLIIRAALRDSRAGCSVLRALCASPVDECGQIGKVEHSGLCIGFLSTKATVIFEDRGSFLDIRYIRYIRYIFVFKLSIL
jgi:hypothetical protein